MLDDLNKATKKNQKDNLNRTSMASVKNRQSDKLHNRYHHENDG